MIRRLRYPDLSQGCVGAWCPSQDQSRSTLVTDFSGWGNNVELTNMDPSTDWMPSDEAIALDFDGTNDLAKKTSVTGPILMPAFTGIQWAVSAWIYRRAIDSVHRIISTSDTGVSGWFVTIRTGSGPNTLSGGTINVARTNGNIFRGTTVVTAGVWHHVALNYYGVSTNPVGECFLNGRRESYIALGLGYTGALTSSTLAIGANGDGSQSFNGMLDDVRVYNRLLTQSEVKTLSTRRGIAYETLMERRGRIPVGTTFKAAWLMSRQSQIIGGGLK